MTVKSYLIPNRDKIQDTFYISFKMHAFKMQFFWESMSNGIKAIFF